MRYLIVGLIALAVTITALSFSPLFAQSPPVPTVLSGTLPSEVQIRPTLCPCEIVLLDAPRGVSGMLAEFTDRKAVVVGPSLIGAGGVSTPSSEWIFVPGITTNVSKVTKREIWQASWADTLDQIGIGTTDVVLLTYNIPLTAELTRIVIDDDDGNVIVVWP